MITKNDIIEKVLAQYSAALGVKETSYRNHVYRVFNLCLLMDQSNQDKYAIAAVFHDIGIWTHQTFDYLLPSRTLALDYLESIGKAEWKDEISLMIDMHHKRSKYKEEYSATVEVFRKADWIDLTLGIKHFGHSKKEIALTRNTFPSKGFHLFLVKQSIINFFKNPSNPLPMFKK